VARRQEEEVNEMKPRPIRYQTLKRRPSSKTSLDRICSELVSLRKEIALLREARTPRQPAPVAQPEKDRRLAEWTESEKVRKRAVNTAKARKYYASHKEKLVARQAEVRAKHKAIIGDSRRQKLQNELASLLLENHQRPNTEIAKIANCDKRAPATARQKLEESGQIQRWRGSSRPLPTEQNQSKPDLLVV
jgi:hypothetical protein